MPSNEISYEQLVEWRKNMLANQLAIYQLLIEKQVATQTEIDDAVIQATKIVDYLFRRGMNSTDQQFRDDNPGIDGMLVTIEASGISARVDGLTLTQPPADPPIDPPIPPI